MPAQTPDEWERRSAAMGPRRVGRGALTVGNRRSRLSPEDREARRQLMKERQRWVALLATYWTDGRRTLLEIAERAEAKSGRHDVEGLVRYDMLLEEMELVGISRE